MRFKKPLLQLPVRFCADSLAAEVKALPDSAWLPHPRGYVGNEAVPLVSPHGEITDSVDGPMAATEHLRRCPYIMAVMAELGGVWGRSRLMGLAPGSEVPSHIDIHYYWRTHIRIHIPVITNPSVRFTCGGDSVHMAPGECWIFDSFQLHDVQNQGDQRRIHLVIDTVGGENLWRSIEAAGQGVAPPADPWMPEPDADPFPSLTFETINIPEVMSSWEVRCHIDFLLENAAPHPMLEPLASRLERFAAAWGASWYRFGNSDDGVPAYRRLIAEVRSDLAAMSAREVALTNGAPLDRALNAIIFNRAVKPNRNEEPSAATGTRGRQHAT